MFRDSTHPYVHKTFISLILFMAYTERVKVDEGWFICKDPWANPDAHPDTTVEVMATRLNERGENVNFKRMIDEYVALAPTDRPISVLDIGCGTGVVIRSFVQTAHPASAVFGADISQKLIDQAKKLDVSGRILWIKLDVESKELPFDAATFDVITMHTLLSHVSDPVAMLRMAARCLKPDGMMVVFDADHAGTVYGLPDFSLMMEINLKLARGIATQPDICRQLPRYLKAADLKMSGNPKTHVIAECCKGDYFLSSVRGFARLIPALGLLPPEQGEAWTAQMLQSHDDGTFFASGIFYTYIVTK
jgi:ubiquinone/menaquinone biosynthesis C-methylase UbiE